MLGWPRDAADGLAIAAAAAAERAAESHARLRARAEATLARADAVLLVGESEFGPSVARLAERLGVAPPRAIDVVADARENASAALAVGLAARLARDGDSAAADELRSLNALDDALWRRERGALRAWLAARADPDTCGVYVCAATAPRPLDERKARAFFTQRRCVAQFDAAACEPRGKPR